MFLARTAWRVRGLRHASWAASVGVRAYPLDKGDPPKTGLNSNGDANMPTGEDAYFTAFTPSHVTLGSWRANESTVPHLVHRYCGWCRGLAGLGGRSVGLQLRTYGRG